MVRGVTLTRSATLPSPVRKSVGRVTMCSPPCWAAATSGSLANSCATELTIPIRPPSPPPKLLSTLPSHWTMESIRPPIIFEAVSKMIGGLMDSIVQWLGSVLSSLGGGEGGLIGIVSSVAQLFASEPEVAAAQHGGEHIVTRPTLFLTGEGNVAERVSVTPLTMGGGRGTGGQGMTINFNGPTIMDEYSSKLWTRDLAR